MDSSLIRTTGWKLKVLVFVTLAVAISLSQIVPFHFSGNRNLSVLNGSQFIEYLDQKIPELMDDYSVPGVAEPEKFNRAVRRVKYQLERRIP